MGAKTSKAIRDLDHKRGTTTSSSRTAQVKNPEEKNETPPPPPPTVHAVIEPHDPTPEIPSSAALSTTSLSIKRMSKDMSANTSVATTWRPDDPENSRSYHAIETSDYVLPSDVLEQTRLELQHKILRYAFGSHIVCPAARDMLRSGSHLKVLDVGCANGAWLDSLYAEESVVGCEFHGVDIAEEAITSETVYASKLIVGNVLERLPCGYIELIEFNVLSFNSGPCSMAIAGPMAGAMEKRGMDVWAGSHLYDNVVLAGGVN
ncbi:hypothetical protein HDU98_003758, partial [Podochytrium sp. JEL0797]